MVENIWGSVMTSENRGKKFDKEKMTSKKCPVCYNDGNFLFEMFKIDHTIELECKFCGYIEVNGC